MTLILLAYFVYKNFNNETPKVKETKVVSKTYNLENPDNSGRSF